LPFGGSSDKVIVSVKPIGSSEVGETVFCKMLFADGDVSSAAIFWSGIKGIEIIYPIEVIRKRGF